MEAKIVESSLNLRIERGMKRDSYTLSKEVALRQLSISPADVFANVEFMDCNNAGYLKAFEDAGYSSYISLDENGRGILCEIKNGYEVDVIREMKKPHMQHLRVKKGKDFFDLITVRLLVSNGGDADFKDRNIQWKKVVNYIATLPDRSHVVLTGDFNHGVIYDSIDDYRGRPRQYFNYQTVVGDLEKADVSLCPIDGESYRGYMTIDHIATGQNITVDSAEYVDEFGNTDEIGVPDHKCIFARITMSQMSPAAIGGGGHISLSAGDKNLPPKR